LFKQSTSPAPRSDGTLQVCTLVVELTGEYFSPNGVRNRVLLSKYKSEELIVRGRNPRFYGADNVIAGSVHSAPSSQHMAHHMRDKRERPMHHHQQFQPTTMDVNPVSFNAAAALRQYNFHPMLNNVQIPSNNHHRTVDDLSAHSFMNAANFGGQPAAMNNDLFSAMELMMNRPNCTARGDPTAGRIPVMPIDVLDHIPSPAAPLSNNQQQQQFQHHHSQLPNQQIQQEDGTEGSTSATTAISEQYGGAVAVAHAESVQTARFHLLNDMLQAVFNYR
jgi:hypothetical protein